MQRRDRLMADAVPHIVVLCIGLVLHIVLPKRRAVCFCICPCQAQEGAHIVTAARRDPRQAVKACSAGHAEQHSFRLVRKRMCCSDGGLLLGRQPVEPPVPKPARPFFTGVLRDLHALTHSVIYEQFYPLAGTERPHKVRICLGLQAADTMVHMGRQHFDFQIAAAAKQKKQQSHRVCPSGAGCNDSVARFEQPLLTAIGQQGLLDALHQFFRIRIHGSHPNC